MIFKIPFAFGPLDKTKKRAAFFRRFIHFKKESKLAYYLQNTDAKITREEYLAICLYGFVISFFAVFFVMSSLLFVLQIEKAILFSFGLALLFSGFFTFSRLIYPRVYNTRKQREIESNLIAALDDMLVQLNSGIPLFSILVNISMADYGALSEEFKKIVRKINAGLPQTDVLDEAGEKNTSLYLRRTLWQISNGMKTGSDISIVVRDSINTLSDEQLIQIQSYGNKLNPMVMFYMLISIILPALSITFLTVISSLINLPKTMTSFLFIGLFIGVVFIQIMFLGVIKSIRPSLLQNA